MSSFKAGYIFILIERGMINRKQLKKNMQMAAIKSGFVKWLEEELQKTNFDLSDEHCTFIINRHYDLRGSIIILQIYCCPKRGAFEGIEFRPKIHVNSLECMKRPNIYNDRRIFHPNINIFSCQFISKELVTDWNPTKQQKIVQNRFQTILKYLKYLILEPNCYFIPNNPLNRKAAWNYHFNRANYWKLILENCPLYLDSQISLHAQTQNSMDIEREEDYHKTNDFWSIQKAFPKRKKIPSVLESLDSNEEDNIQLLSKKIKLLTFDSEKELHEETCIEEKN